ncbi:MAG: PepSY domain-containing protein [Deltaproteobacteria bacterium]|nr:PepSY domain-containing protein [Deltaproteobacteria bacterium]
MGVSVLLAVLVAAAVPVLKEAKPGLRAKAKVTYEAAQKAALAKVPGAEIVEAELEREHGKLVYSFDLKSAGKDGIDEVQVDAKTGAVLSVEHEDAAAEAAERKKDEAEKARK